MPPEYHVLLAEDNPVNQEVGRAMLETLGCNVDVVDNGLEALRMVTSNRYNLVFMDCQMPRMGGLEATARIRDAESGKSRRTPVIALTAYVMDDEIAECRAAGMDDYLGKPFSLKDLSEILNRWAGSTIPANSGGDNGCSAILPENRVDASVNAAGNSLMVSLESACLDPRALDNLRATFGARAGEMTRMVINIYMKDSPALLTELRGALRAGDRETMHRAVHTLKSSSANLGAGFLAESCKKLENRIKEGSLVDCETMIEDITAQHRQVLQALQEIIDRGI